MRKVRIEEIAVRIDEEFSKDVWIESDAELYDTLEYKNNSWIVVEVE